MSWKSTFGGLAGLVTVLYGAPIADRMLRNHFVKPTAPYSPNLALEKQMSDATYKVRGREGGNGTAFHIISRGNHYLLTNYHVASATTMWTDVSSLNYVPTMVSQGRDFYYPAQILAWGGIQCQDERLIRSVFDNSDFAILDFSEHPDLLKGTDAGINIDPLREQAKMGLLPDGGMGIVSGHPYGSPDPVVARVSYNTSELSALFWIGGGWFDYKLRALDASKPTPNGPVFGPGNSGSMLTSLDSGLPIGLVYAGDDSVYPSFGLPEPIVRGYAIPFSYILPWIDALDEAKALDLRIGVASETVCHGESKPENYTDTLASTGLPEEIARKHLRAAPETYGVHILSADSPALQDNR